MFLKEKKGGSVITIITIMKGISIAPIYHTRRAQSVLQQQHTHTDTHTDTHTHTHRPGNSHSCVKKKKKKSLGTATEQMSLERRFEKGQENQTGGVFETWRERERERETEREREKRR